MDFQRTLKYLYSALPMYQRVGKSAYKKDLDNTIALCEALGNPQKKIKSIHIAGTNGKGSSSHMIAAILQTAGYRTGLYTSPHLKNFTERIRIDGEEITEEAVIDFVGTHKMLIETIKPSFFEITVVMAFDYFVKQEVDIAIIEVGLGGRLDSTNVITPEVSLITNISLDHQEILGNTLTKIAIEKAGIMKKHIPVVIGNKQPQISEVFEHQANSIETAITFAEEIYDVKFCAEGLYQVNKNNKLIFDSLQSQLLGSYQQYNIAGVLCTIDQLNNMNYSITSNHIKNGLANTVDLTSIKGRWQILNDEPLKICDTGHNIDGVRSIVEQILSIPYNNLYVIWGMVDDKDSGSILKLLPKTARYYFCRADTPRAKNAQLLYKEAKKIGLQGEVIEDVNWAIEAAEKQANSGDLIFIGGSTFVVAEINDL